MAFTVSAISAAEAVPPLVRLLGDGRRVKADTPQERAAMARDPTAVVAIMSFSNRMFWTKAVRLWTESNAYQRVLVAASYFKYAGGFESLGAFEITLPEGGDPTFVVQARKQDAGAPQSKL